MKVSSEQLFRGHGRIRVRLEIRSEHVHDVFRGSGVAGPDRSASVCYISDIHVPSQIIILRTGYWFRPAALNRYIKGSPYGRPISQGVSKLRAGKPLIRTSLRLRL
jgi:hypothetical protein